ncbi:hypothetical protein LUU34_00634300 [Aix galericulata]|nr:hypothetical protein LUU34_00634300 [Aix galericulata]
MSWCLIARFLRTGLRARKRRIPTRAFLGQGSPRAYCQDYPRRRVPRVLHMTQCPPTGQNGFRDLPWGGVKVE